MAGQTEDYVEYSRSGQVIKGRESAKARTKYDEDGKRTMMCIDFRAQFSHYIVYPGNHTSVWGSWYNLSSAQWGFACCHSTIINSYCAGAAGIRAVDESSAEQLLNNPNAPSDNRPSSLGGDQPLAGRGKRDQATELAEIKTQQESSFSKRRLGEGDLQLDRGKLEAALNEQRGKRRKEREEDEEWMGDKRPKYNSYSGGAEVTEEELEAYRRTRIASTEDPVSLESPLI